MVYFFFQLINCLIFFYIINDGTLGQWAALLANAEPFADVVTLAPDWKSYTGERIHHGNLDFSSADIARPLPWPSSSFGQ